MSAWDAVRELIALLKTLPPATVPPGHVGLRRPGALSELPAVTVSVSDVQEALAGVGGLVGSRPVSDTQWSTGTATRTTGTVGVELWAADADAVGSLAAGALDLLAGPGAPAALGAHGFLRLAVRSIGPEEGAPVGNATAARLPLTFAFAFESVGEEEVGPDGIIRRVHVDMRDTFDEAMDLS